MADYKIRDVEILTGIKAHTLRIWEKRYGLLVPDRTDTQIRTYSDEELSFLLNISLLNKHGIKISKIAALSKNDIAEKVWDLHSVSVLDTSGEQFVLALIEMDERMFTHTLQALIDEIGLEKAFTNHLVPFMERIGVMFLVGSINPAQEHFMSNVIRQKVITEIDNLPIPVVDDQPILLFLPEHEWHELGLLFYQYLLRKNGFSTFYLGQSLPYDSLIQSIKLLNPRAVISSWLTAVEEAFILNYFEKLQKDAPDVLICAGGAQMKTHLDKLPRGIKPIEKAIEVLHLVN
ncbi:MAG: MerR family transcriptional regulator [Bacteroidetes bacterium]|nr:MerR family transcriptional regulator [Bacteroidota bacterium]